MYIAPTFEIFSNSDVMMAAGYGTSEPWGTCKSGNNPGMCASSHLASDGSGSCHASHQYNWKKP